LPCRNSGLALALLSYKEACMCRSGQARGVVGGRYRGFKEKERDRRAGIDVRRNLFSRSPRLSSPDARNDGTPPTWIRYLLMVCCDMMTGIGLVRGVI
jgi:hypothetical protein